MSTKESALRKSLSDWISQAEVARLRGISRQAIGRLVRRGRLETLTVGNTKFVSRTDVMNFVPAPAGRKEVK